ncbi:hypothetical protein BKA70DRAFT_1412170 [Coprinopsis sp. MPI-PUGE-AT-0042]|nr:hypothetical protein BKA70DRAFT_1412170 [Coprinopsis sp. MPI-PUGE-AT-0042]
MPPAMKVDEVELNYVFVPGGGCPPPGAGLPSPLPVSVPESLLHRPSAHLRASIIESLRGEGIQVEQRELRFWKPKRPLKASDVVSDLSTWFLGTGDGERRFIAMALTESPLTSFGERIRRAPSSKNILEHCGMSQHEQRFDPLGNTEINAPLGTRLRNRRNDHVSSAARGDLLHHLVVTSGKAPYILEPPSPGPSNIGLTPPLTITIGTEGFPKGREPAEKGARHHDDVSIVEASSASRDVAGEIPVVLLGVHHLDVRPDSSTIQLVSHISNLHPDGFRMYVDSGKDNILHGVHLSWMAISPSLPSPSITTEGIQYGVADSHFSSPQKQGCRRSRHRVNFRWTYEQPPEVFACLAGLTTGGDESPQWDMRTYVTNIDQKGFVLHVERVQFSEPNKAVAHAQVSWMAFPYGGTADLQLACGEINMEDGTQLNEGSTFAVGSSYSMKGWRGKLTFAEKFTSPPQVFSAFTSFELPATTLRMVSETENITKEGMEWKIGTWIGNPARSATIAFLAIGRR